MRVLTSSLSHSAANSFRCSNNAHCTDIPIILEGVRLLAALNQFNYLLPQGHEMLFVCRLFTSQW